MGFLGGGQQGCRKRRGGLAALLVAVLLLAPVSARSQESLELYEQKIKAGLVYNFLKYTTWPAETLARGRLRVCLLGEGSFDSYLYPLRGRTAQQLSIDIARVDGAGEARSCHLLFIHRSEAGALPGILAALKDSHVLTVSDIDRFAARGGMVELTLLDRRVGLRINAGAVSSRGLAIQPRLMKLSAPAG